MEKGSFYIILADDDEGDRLMFVEALEELEMQPNIQTAINGIELMELLTKNDNLLPHLIFLDLNMPRKNGLECLKEIRSNENFKEISTVIYSTSSHEKDIEETFINGANIYLTKPDDFNILKKLLHKAITTTQLYRKDSFKRANFFLKI